METKDRRTFLKLMGSPAFAAALPLNLSQVLSIPAHTRTGTIEDVEHIVFLMQENRSFDHYFGTMQGVRGFADPRAVNLPSGKSVWHQPNGSGVLLPFRPDVENLGRTFLPDPPHGWADTHAAWNAGHYDRWVPTKGVTTMTYHTRRDLPYQLQQVDVQEHEAQSKSWWLSRTQGWYGLAITVEADAQFQYHFAGHLENGEDSISDPIMGGLV
jgi:phospholipase C